MEENKHQELHDLLQLKEKMLYAFTESANELISNLDFPQAIEKSLKLIGEAIDINRISIYGNHEREGEEYTSLKFEWNSDESVAPVTDYPELKLDLFQPVVSQLKAGQIFQTAVNNLSDDYLFKKLLQQNKVKSILIIPIYRKDYFWGFIAFNEYETDRIWSLVIQLLKSFTNCISSAIDRDETSKSVIQKNEQLQLFQYLIDNSSDGIQVSYESGQLFYLNKTASERLGIKVEDCHHFFVKDIESIFIDDNAWNQHVRSVKGKDFLLIQGENTSLDTGRKFPVEVTVKYVKIANEGFMVANSRDISDRIEKEKHLKTQEEKYRNIISNMNLGLLEVDLNQNIVYCNRSFTNISGYTMAEVLGKNALKLLIDENTLKSGFIEGKLKARKEGESDGYELLVKNKNGEPRWWFLSGAPNYNDKGEFIGTVGIYLDITDQKRLAIDLEYALLEAKMASQAKESFLANMSHEIRTPLNGIIGMIRGLDKGELSKNQKEYVDGAKKASQHLLSIVNNVLDFSKIEAGELQLDSSPFSLKNVLGDVVNILANQASEQGIYIDLNFDECISPVFIGDEGRIRQILINIIGNAVKFTEKGGVKISCIGGKCEKKSQNITIEIQDTGIGMEKEFVDKIFTKFQQEDISNSRKYGGSGLGMVITKELIDLMNGLIHITSTKNGGTLVVIDFCFQIGEQNSLQKIDQKLSLEVLKGKSILLVEDNLMNQLVLTNTLSGYDIEITVVVNGLEAIEKLKVMSFDLILMDIQMPVMNGLEATIILRNELKINTPIIALSANAFRSDIDKCIQVGMNDYITKPFEEKDLLNTVFKVMNLNVSFDSQKIKDMEIEKTDLFSINKLQEMGDDQFVSKMLYLFVETTPPFIVRIKKAIENQDIEEIKRVAHTIKPSFDSFMIEAIYNDVCEMEQFNDFLTSVDELFAKAEHVTSVLLEIVEEMKEHQLYKRLVQ